MAVTLKDIAQRAGVSVSTVSRIINHDENKPASAETAQRVWRIVHELQYVPNQAARQLISMTGEEQSRRRSIGCILSSCEDSYLDPFFPEVISGIQQETAARGYVMEYTFPISLRGDTDSAFFNNLVSRKVDGGVLLGRIQPALLEMLQSHIPHLVYCGLNYLPGEINQVICDAREAMAAVVDYLVGLGHRQIGYLGTVNGDGSLLNEWRCAAYTKRLNQLGLTADPRHIHETDVSLAGGYQAMAAALDRGEIATAYCCANDVTAIGAMRAILERGLRIPEDVSVIGFDDIEMASYVLPQLTTIHVWKREMGTRAVQTLLDSIEGKLTVHACTLLPFSLVERGSCAPPA